LLLMNDTINTRAARRVPFTNGSQLLASVDEICAARALPVKRSRIVLDRITKQGERFASVLIRMANFSCNKLFRKRLIYSDGSMVGGEDA
jgi:hypothetical protein